MTPVLPSEFEALIPLPADTICQALIKVCIKFPILWWRWYTYAYTEDLSFNTGFAQAICDVKTNCS